MADINDGSLSFTSTMDNDQMNAAIDETLRRIQGLSDGTVDGTMAMSDAFERTSEGVRMALGAIGAACEQHENALVGLEAEYERLKAEQATAFMEGRDQDARAIQKSMNNVKGEIMVRQKLLNELRDASNELENEAQALNRSTNAAEQTNQAHTSLRTRIREIKEEMADMVMNGIDEQADAYIRLRDELGRLQDLQGDISAQGNVLANDEAQYQGIITGINGVMGAMSAATGVAALFGEENEELQRTMLKIQSLMAITQGMQQVSQTLNKDSAFMITTIGGLKSWWAKVVAAATTAEVAETAAIGANTAAQGVDTAATGANAAATAANTAAQEANAAARGQVTAASGAQATANAAATAGQTAQTAAATAGTVANFTLAGAFRAVGVAIKSIPVFGWILAGISAIIGLIALFTGKSKEAEEQTKKWNAAEEAGAKAFITAKTELDDYIHKLDTFNGSQAEEKKLLDDVNGKYGEQLGYAKTIKEAKEILTSKGAAYCEMLKLEAMAQALLNEATSAYINILKTKQKAEAGDFDDSWYEFWNWGGKSSEDKRNEAIANAKKDYEYWLDEYEKMRDKAAKYKDDHDLGGWTDPTAVTVKPTYTPKSTTTQKTPEEERKEKFQKALDAMRMEYDRFNKWMASGDEILINSAKTEFAGLLGQGASYIDFLKKQREQLLTIAEGSRSTEQNEQLAAINNAIAEETRQTVLESFNQELNAQLANAKTITDMLNVIEQRRKELANDGTELDTEKGKTLDDAEKRIKDQAKADYESMLNEYGTFEQRKAILAEEFAKKRALAESNGNTEMLAELEKAYNELLSKFALDEMMKSPDWELMFGDLDELTTTKLNELLNKVEGMTAYMGVEFSPEDLAKIKDAIQKMKDEVQERNPFKSLKSALKDYSKATDDAAKKKALTNVFESAAGAADIVNAGIKGVIDIMGAMGVEADSEAMVIANDLMKIGESAGQLATGIATGNPISIIQGSVGMLTAAFDLFNFKDRKAERQIKKHQKALKDLQRTYEDLERAIDKALGGDVYKGQMDAIHNMEAQIVELNGAIAAEDSKKKTDHDRIQDWKDQINDLENNIEDMYESIANDILQTDAKSFADELGNALAEAFSSGEDAALAFEKTVNDVLKRAILNQLKKNFLEKQLQGVLDDLEKSMGYWDGDTFHFDGFTDSEIADFRNRVGNIASTFNQALGQYGDIFKDIMGDDADPSSMVGAVKGVTEETAEIIAGQMQAIRMNQAENTAMMTQAIQSLAIIATNTSFNRHLAKIDRIITLLESNSSDAALRGNGIQI